MTPSQPGAQEGLAIGEACDSQPRGSRDIYTADLFVTCGFAELPAGCLLGRVVPAAQGGQITDTALMRMRSEARQLRPWPVGLRYDERSLAAADPRVAGVNQDHDGPVRSAPAHAVPLRQRQLGRQPRR